MPRRGMFKGNVCANGTTLHKTLAMGEGFMKTINKSLIIKKQYDFEFWVFW